MADPRIVNFAKVLVDYSLEVRKGQTVLLQSTPLADALVRECYRLLLRRGAFVRTKISLPEMDRIFYEEASPEQRKHLDPFDRRMMKEIDARLLILAESNSRSLTNVNPDHVAEVASAHKPVMRTFMDRSASGDLKWVLTRWPTPSSAQDAEMSLSEYEEFVLEAGHLADADPIKTWKRISKSQQALTDAMNKAKEVRVVAEDTDLTFRCAGRKWINCDGTMNFPDGEVFTGPVEDSVNGHIRFSFPAIRSGREVLDPLLEFRNGKVVRAEASKGQDFLRAMIDMDKGASCLGEAAFGTNYSIKQFTRCTLFDEKIGGSVHFALGAGYPETGSKNRSALHWDMICDLRKGGKVYVDGELFQERGKFLDSRFPQPTGRKGTAKRSRKGKR